MFIEHWSGSAVCPIYLALVLVTFVALWDFDYLKSILERFHLKNILISDLVINRNKFWSVKPVRYYRFYIEKWYLTSSLSGIFPKLAPRLWSIPRIQGPFGQNWSEIYTAVDPGPIGSSPRIPVQIHQTEKHFHRHALLQLQSLYVQNSINWNFGKKLAIFSE